MLSKKKILRDYDVSLSLFFRLSLRIAFVSCLTVVHSTALRESFQTTPSRRFGNDPRSFVFFFYFSLLTSDELAWSRKWIEIHGETTDHHFSIAACEFLRNVGLANFTFLSRYWKTISTRMGWKRNLETKLSHTQILVLLSNHTHK